MAKKFVKEQKFRPQRVGVLASWKLPRYQRPMVSCVFGALASSQQDVLPRGSQASRVKLAGLWCCKLTAAEAGTVAPRRRTGGRLQESRGEAISIGVPGGGQERSLTPQPLPQPAVQAGHFVLWFN